MALLSSFPPVSGPDARLLVLGSMPGEASLAAGQYYAHPRNGFWRIMGELTGAGPALPYGQRLAVLRKNRIALWDVLKNCVREGSLDSDIQEETPQDFAAFFAAHPGITHVFFNGGKAAGSFRKFVLLGLKNTSLQFVSLPSTSPANASWSFERKLEKWREISAVLR